MGAAQTKSARFWQKPITAALNRRPLHGFSVAAPILFENASLFLFCSRSLYEKRLVFLLFLAFRVHIFSDFVLEQPFLKLAGERLKKDMI